MQTKCNQLVGLNGGYGVSGMGEISDDEVAKIFQQELLSVPAATLTNCVLTGNYTAISAQIRKATERVCLMGAVDKGQNFLKDYWYYIVGVIILIWILK